MQHQYAICCALRAKPQSKPCTAQSLSHADKHAWANGLANGAHTLQRQMQIQYINNSYSADMMSGLSLG